MSGFRSPKTEEEIYNAYREKLDDPNANPAEAVISGIPGFFDRVASAHQPVVALLKQAVMTDNLKVVKDMYRMTPEMFQDTPQVSLDLPHLAVEKGSLKVIDFFLGTLKRADSVDMFGDNYVCCAARNGQFPALKKLIEEYKCDINSKTRTHMPAWALCFDHDLEETYGSLPLHVKKKVKLDMLKYFVDHGADLSVRSRDGNPAFNISLRAGALDCLKYLFSEENSSQRDKLDFTGTPGPSECYTLNRSLELARHYPLCHLVASEAIRREEKKKKSGDPSNLLGASSFFFFFLLSFFSVLLSF
jgi:ankyrin repeat protein